MRRAVINLFPLFSFAVALAAIVLMVRSYRFTQSQAGESLTFTRRDPQWWVISHRGTLTLCRQNGKDWGREFGRVEAMGFKFGGLSGPGGSLWNLAVPYWFIAGAAVVTASLSLLQRRRQRTRENAGFCRQCGYDLRASPGRCPECGAPSPVPQGFPPG